MLRAGHADVRFRPTPQADGPVKVLLNPEMTMRHIDASGGGYTQNLDGVVTGRVSVTRLNFDTVEPIVPASGKAENDITPNGIRLLNQAVLTDLVNLTALIEEGASSSLTSQLLRPLDRMGAPVELLCELDTTEDFVSALNSLLAKNHAAARICRATTEPC